MHMYAWDMHMCVHIHSDVCGELYVWVITHMCMPACGGPMSQSSSTTLTPCS